MKNAVPNQSRFRPALESLEDRRVCSVNSLAFLSEALTTAAVVQDQLVETASVDLPPAPISTALNAPLATVADVVTTTLPGALDAVVEIGAVLTTEVTTVVPLAEVLGSVLDAPVVTVVDIVTTTLPEVPGASELPLVIDVGAESPPAILPGGPIASPDVNQTVPDSNASAASNLWWMQFSVAANTALFMQQLTPVQNAGMENSRDTAIAAGLNIVLTDMQLLAEIDDAAMQALAANFPSEVGEEWLRWELLDLEETLDGAIAEAGILAGTGMLGLGMLSEAFDDFLRELAELQRTLWNWLAQIGPMPWILMAAAALVSVREGMRWRLQLLQAPRVSPLGLQIC